MTDTLCVQFEDPDGEDGYFYNTAFTDPQLAVADAFQQHQTIDFGEVFVADDLTVKRIFIGRFDGYNLAPSEGRSVQDYLSCSN